MLLTRLIDELFLSRGHPTAWQDVLDSLGGRSAETVLAVIWRGNWDGAEVGILGSTSAKSLSVAAARYWLANAPPTMDLPNVAAPDRPHNVDTALAENVPRESEPIVLRHVLHSPFPAQFVATGPRDAGQEIDTAFNAMLRHESDLTHALLATAAHVAVSGRTLLLHDVASMQSGPAAIVDPFGRLVVANDAYRASRPRWGRLFAEPESRPSQPVGASTALFREAVQSVVGRDDRIGQALWLRGEDHDEHECIVLLPIGRRPSRAPTEGSSPLEYVLVLFRALSDQSLCSPEFVRRTFSLTPAEARLVAALAAGSTVSAYAHSQGLTVNTVRWHVRNVLQKTGCRTQTDLVRLVLMSLLR